MASEQEQPADGGILAVDTGENDSDSALGESVAGSYTASLASSVLKYRYENGRRYHGYREGSYIMPNDEPEQNRLDMLHHIFRMISGGALSSAPVTEHGQLNRVLDLGTGTGIWAIDFADEFPNSVVIGNDLSPIQPTWIPPNCKFYVEDIEGEWNYAPENHFDYIHGRGLCGSITDFKRMFRQAYENLNPGGWFEMQEFQNKVCTDDGTLGLVGHLTHWVEELDGASEKFGRSLRIAHLMKGWMEEVGFVNVEEKVFKVPIGTWPKDKTYKRLGLYYLAQFLDTVEPVTLALFTRVLSYSKDEVNTIITNVKNDLQNRSAHAWVHVHFVWGQKPN